MHKKFVSTAVTGLLTISIIIAAVAFGSHAAFASSSNIQVFRVLGSTPHLMAARPGHVRD
jgi:hypothetical protein